MAVISRSAAAIVMVGITAICGSKAFAGDSGAMSVGAPADRAVGLGDPIKHDSLREGSQNPDSLNQESGPFVAPVKRERPKMPAAVGQGDATVKSPTKPTASSQTKPSSP